MSIKKVAKYATVDKFITLAIQILTTVQGLLPQTKSVYMIFINVLTTWPWNKTQGSINNCKTLQG